MQMIYLKVQDLKVFYSFSEIDVLKEAPSQFHNHVQLAKSELDNQS